MAAEGLPPPLTPTPISLCQGYPCAFPSWGDTTVPPRGCVTGCGVHPTPSPVSSESRNYVRFCGCSASAQPGIQGALSM